MKRGYYLRILVYRGIIYMCENYGRDKKMPGTNSLPCVYCGQPFPKEGKDRFGRPINGWLVLKNHQVDQHLEEMPDIQASPRLISCGRVIEG